jgi:transposase
MGWTPPFDSIGIDVPKSSCSGKHKEEPVEKHTLIAVDLAKSVFEIAVSHEDGKVAKRRRLARSAFLEFFATSPKATVIMEACGSAHFWGREIEKLGHRVVLLAPHQVRPYVHRNKTDRTDAKGLLEAYRNEDFRPVPLKTLAQQALTSIHRLRAGWIAARTAQVNSLRGLLREFGYTIPQGIEKVLPQVRLLIADADSDIPDSLRAVLFAACEQVTALSERIVLAERQLQALAEETPVVARLRTIPGLGPITASALVAFVGDVQRFPSARHFASYLGLTPKEFSSGSRRRLGRISKRGDIYLRTLLIHGARSVLFHARRASTHDRLRTWALALYTRGTRNKAVVALANKLARIVWSAWKHERTYEARPQAA